MHINAITLVRRAVLPLALLCCPLLAYAHEGHGTPGTLLHELQHQAWSFGGLIILAALVLALGDRESEDD